MPVVPNDVAYKDFTAHEFTENSLLHSMVLIS